MKKKIVLAFFCFSLIILALAISLIPQGGTHQALASSSTYATISANFQRKTFYAQGYYWLFYCDGSEISYMSSRDGLQWNQPILVREGISASGLSVWYDGGVHYVYASGEPGDQVIYESGTILGDKINWAAEQTVIPGVTGSTFSLTNNEISSNVWALDRATNETSEELTSVVTGRSSEDKYFLFEPGKQVETPIGTALPATCTGKGWRTATKLDANVPEGTWKITVKLSSLDQTAYAGKLFVRLWKMPSSSISDASAITDWIASSEGIFSESTNQTVKLLWVSLPALELKDNYLFIECAWKIETSGLSDGAGVRLETGQASQVSTVTYQYFNGYCVVDSNGYPWASFSVNDGPYWNSLVVKSDALNGTIWSDPMAISNQSLLPVRTCILPLNQGKLYAISSNIDGMVGRLWNGTEWMPEEVISNSTFVQDYGFSAVANGDNINVALLENVTNNILHFQRTVDGWQKNLIQVDQDLDSFPALSTDKSSGELYCFWLHSNSLCMKRYSSEGWDNSISSPFGAKFTLPRGISCFYQVMNGKIGVAWIEESNGDFRLKYTSLDISSNNPNNVGVKGNASEFFMYATQSCGKCQEQVSLLKRLYGNDSVTFYDITDDPNREYYIKLTGALVDANVFSVSDPNRGLIPLSGFFGNGTLQAIVLGPISETEWQRIVESKPEINQLQCFIGSANSNLTISSPATAQSLSALFTQTTQPISASQKDNLPALVPLLSVAAAIDAVNPCELNAFLILLVYVFYQVGKKDVLKIGLSFSCAVFISYYLLGLGALRILQSIPIIKFGIIAFGVTIGALEVTAFLGLKRKHVPDSFSTRIRESVKKAINPYTAFIAGILVSFFLLPCTSGSYFVALNLLAKNATFGDGLLLLTLYNAIVVLPFLIMTVAIYTVTFRTKKLRLWLNEKERWLRLFTGLTMIAISLTLLL